MFIVVLHWYCFFVFVAWWVFLAGRFVLIGRLVGRNFLIGISGYVFSDTGGQRV